MNRFFFCSTKKFLNGLTISKRNSQTHGKSTFDCGILFKNIEQDRQHSTNIWQFL